jgi:DNA replication and repair protein RecF
LPILPITVERAAAAPPGAAFAVTRLTLTGFRSYAALRLEVGPEPVVLVGANGAGKTNLLEALSLLAPGPGLRGARGADLSHRGAANADPSAGTVAWAVSATVTGPAGAVDIGTGRAAADGAGTRRALRVDGTAMRNQAELAEHVNVQWLTPQMDRLFVEAPAGRRRFLDRMILGLDPGHARRVAAYQRVMRARARLLGQGGHAAWLDALEETMAGHAVAVAAARRDFVARLGAALAAGFGPFPAAEVTVEGEIEDALGARAAIDVESDLKDSLAASRGADAESGTTRHGPHRSDLAVRHLGKDFPADQCSTGEQKALLLAMVLANARLHGARAGRMPVLLLDEVAAHLDRGRRADLVEALCALGAQAWLTGTDAALFEAFAGRAQLLHVGDGRVAESPFTTPSSQQSVQA